MSGRSTEFDIAVIGAGNHSELNHGPSLRDVAAAGTLQLDEDRVVGQPFGPVANELARQHRADGAVEIAHGLDELDLLAAGQRRGGHGDCRLQIADCRLRPEPHRVPVCHAPNVVHGGMRDMQNIRDSKGGMG